MKKQTFKQAMLAFMAGAAVMSACVDDKYDLSNLDTTIQVGSSELKLPKCSTGDIVLDNLFNLNNGYIKENDGLYYLDKGGQADPNQINIAKISIDAPQITGFTATLPRESQVQQSIGEVKRNGGLVGDFTPSQIEEKINEFLSQHPQTYIYDFEGKANFSFNGQQSDRVNRDVIRIDSVDFEQGFGISYDVSVQDHGRLIKVHLDGLALELPSGFNISKATYEETGSNVGRTIDGIIKTTDGRTRITFFEGEDVVGFNLNNQLKINLSITGAAINAQSLIHFEKAEGQEGIARIIGDQIQLHGRLRATEKDVNTQAPDMELWNQLQQEGNISALLPLNVKFVGQGSFEDGTNNAQKKITIKTFSGKIEHEIGTVNDIDLSDKPDFLDDEDVVLDLANPQLFLTVRCDIPTTIETGIALTAIRKNDPDNANRVLTTITYDGTKGEQIIALAEDVSNIDWPKDAIQERQTQKVENLKNLIRTIPERIKVTGSTDEIIKVVLNDCKKIELGCLYNVGLQYRVYSQLSFDKDLQIIYSSTEEGMNLGDDLDDLNEVKSLELTGIAHTDIPFDLKLTAKPLRKGYGDYSQRIIDDLVIEYKNGDEDFQKEGVSIRAKADGTSKDDKFTIRISAKSGHNLSEFLHSGNMQLDGIRYTAVLTNQSSCADPLSPNAKIQLTDIQVCVKGVSYLVNDDRDK